MTGKETQQTPAGATIPVPSRVEVMGAFRKVATAGAHSERYVIQVYDDERGTSAAWYESLDEALEAVDGRWPDLDERQEITDTETGESWVRAHGSVWIPPLR